MFEYTDGMVTRDVIAAAIRQAGTPVCVRADGQMGEEHLARFVRLCVAFLIDWRETGRTVFLKVHNLHPHHLVFLDGRSVVEGEHPEFLAALGGAGVHGCIIEQVSNTFLKQCRKTGRFVSVVLPDSLSVEVLPRRINELLGKSRLSRGWKNVGGMIGTQHAPVFSTLEKCAREFSLLISCTPRDWQLYPSAIQGAVIVAPGTRLIVLPAPPADGNDGWRDEFTTVARQLADALQGAIAAMR